jgi:general secretion pathway protein L
MSRIVAIDPGAWSVKVVLATPGFRGATVTHVVERRVPAGDDPPLSRAMLVVGELVRQYDLKQDSAFIGVGGDQVFTHVLDFPFKSLRRPDLVKAVGGELENVAPIDLEEMVYAFETVPELAAAPVEPGGVQRGRVAAPVPGMRVLSYAMHRERATEVIAAAQRLGFEARGLLAVGGAAARLVDRLPSLAGIRATSSVAVIDIGHCRTDVVVVRAGKAAYSRTIARGGRQVTESIARQWNMTFADAETAKHQDGFVSSAAMPATSEAWLRIHHAVVGELAPLARELRQTFANCRARTGETVSAIVVVGGGARLRGLVQFLGDQLGTPTSGLTAEDVASLAGQAESEGVDSAAMAIGMVHEGATGRPAFNLRQGDLAMRADLSLLRAKAVPLASAAMLVVGFAAASSWAALHKLRKAEKILVDRVAAESLSHFGSVRTADQVLGETTEAPTEVSPMPRSSAYDILLEINGKIPPADKVKIDLTSVAIEHGRVELKGTAKTPEEIDLVVAELKKIDCFEEAQRGATQNTASGDKLFQLTIKASCL